jgi:sugar/nucleoside kinase (ribokinase family)
LFEIYKFEDTPISPDIETAIDQHLQAVLQNYDLVLVTDYGHGMLTAPLINRLCTEARFLAVNTQTNSANFGFNLITKYPRADYVCIDEPEIRLATHDRTTDIYELAKRLSHQLQTQTFTVTRGHRGSISISQNQDLDIVPVFSTEVKDRVGAGDAFLAITAPMVCRQLPNDMVSFVGNAVGAIAVRIVGNRNSVEPVPLQRFITALLK